MQKVYLRGRCVYIKLMIRRRTDRQTDGYFVATLSTQGLIEETEILPQGATYGLRGEEEEAQGEEQ